jgi:hypothetical protein
VRYDIERSRALTDRAEIKGASMRREVARVGGVEKYIADGIGGIRGL